MSRIGIKPITVPAGVEVKSTIALLLLKPKRNIRKDFSKDMIITLEGNEITVKRPSTIRFTILHGLTRTLIANMIEGVTNGFKDT